MSEAENKRRIEGIMAALSAGDGRPFVDAMAEDFCWTITGTSAWSRTYRGKQAVRTELLAPLFAQFADRYTATVGRILADGDHVVVEFRGSVTTKAGKPYNNTYCYVIRMDGGEMKALTEYFDSAHVDAVLEAPA